MTEQQSFKGLALGQQAATKKTFTQEDVDLYIALTGDASLSFGSNSKNATVPGPLLGGMVSYLLGTQLPGRGTNWLKQRYQFFAPVQLDQEITATVEIVRLRPDKDLVNLRTRFFDPTGTVIGEGESLVLVKDLIVRNA